MKICRRRNRWVLDFYRTDAEGHRHRERRTFARRDEAEHAAGKIRGTLSRGTYVAPTSLPTFAQLAADWLRSKQHHRPASQAQWHQHVTAHLTPALGHLRLDHLDVERIERLRDALVTDGLAPQTVNKILTTAAAVLKLGARRGLLERNVAQLAERLRIGAGELDEDDRSGARDGRVRPEDVPTTDEVRRVLAAAGAGHDRTLLLMAALTGIRSGELFGLRWADVDWPAEKLAVRRSVSWARVAGDASPVRFRFFAPKTTAGVRTLPLPPELVAPLKVWKLACPPSPHDLVFPSETGAPLHRSTVLRTVLYPACRRAGVRPFNLKALRHFFASSLIMRGDKITRVAELMGHSSPLVTLKVYSHWLRDSESSGVAELARALCGNDAPDDGATHAAAGDGIDKLSRRSASGHKVVTKWSENSPTRGGKAS